MDVEHSEVLAGEAGSRAVFVNGGRPDCKRWRQGSNGLCELFNGLGVSRSDGLDQVARQGDTGRDGETVACGVAESHGLASEE
jgi:hypothetical protein